MKSAIIIILVLLCGFGIYKYQQKRNLQSEQYALEEEIQQRTSPNGFIDLSINLVGSSDVVILAPINCPSFQAQRADRLTAQLKEKNIPVVRSNSINSRISVTEKDDQLMKRVNLAMNQPAPMVFVNGKVKSNPTLSEVMREYESNKKSSALY